MPTYTTSFTTKRSARLRGRDPMRLPSAARRPQRRRGAQYLRHSQGFGGRGSRSRGGRASGGNSRKPYAIIVVGCALLLFAASILWYANRSVDITLNGERTSVRIGATIERIIDDEGLDLKAGNLLAVDDSVLTKGGGSAYTATLNGKELSAKQAAKLSIEGGEELELADGHDTYEDHDVQATEIKPTLTVDGTGAVQYVETWGVAGRSEVWTGHVSGKTVDKGVVAEPVNCEVKAASVSPSERGKKYVALTFDEGPSSRTAEIVKILQDKQVGATFFLSGEAAEANPAGAAAIADAGFEIGSNAYTETDLSTLSADELRSQLTRGFDAIEQACGVKTALLRAPLGTFTDQMWAESMDLLGAVVTWNVDSGDWLLPGAQSVVETVRGSVKNGNIVVLTDNDTTAAQTIEALPQLIDALQEDGYTLVSLSDLIKTDKNLADAVKLSASSMPNDAVLPQVPATTDAASS